jgi:GAF domain-containing protein
MKSREIVLKVEDLFNETSNSISQKIYNICQLLESQLPHYDWVGFYFAENATKTLHLGPYAGEPTDHKVIPFGKGICGQVAESNSTFLVEDVHAQDNYIACNINVKSEIVVPLFINGENVGQIDIDSNKVNAFSKDDEELLGEINEIISKHLEHQKTDLKSLWV